MIETPIIDAVEEFKSPPIKFIVIAAITIISALAGVIIYQNNNQRSVTQESYQEMQRERDSARADNKVKDVTIAALQDEKYQFILKLYESDQQKKEVAVQMDSMNKQVIKLNHILR